MQLRPLALVASLFGPVALGCSAADSSALPEGYTAAECNRNEVLVASGVAPTKPVDFVAIRSEKTVPRRVADGGVLTNERVADWYVTMDVDARGKPCATASDVEVCKHALALFRLLPDNCEGVPLVTPKAAPVRVQPEPGHCTATYLVYTRGDEIGAVRTREEALAFFGAIDAPAEAFFLARLAGESFTCDEAAWAALDGAYEVRTHGGCGPRTVRVTTDGAVSRISDPCDD